jgi:ABC-2 type transport system permease protein
VRVLAILLKDARHQLASVFGLFMMVVAPLLITGLMYFAFGGLSRGGKPDFTPTRLAVADLDSADAGAGVGPALGAVIVEHLGEGTLGEMLRILPAASGQAARSAVDRREADVALVIPAGFTRTVTAGSGEAEILVYSDPTLSIGPALVRSVVTRITDAMVGARIAASLGAGDPAAAAAGYVRWAESTATVQVSSPAAGQADRGQFAAMLSGIMASMIVFFVFFTAASGAQSLVREHEEGTLARLAATPTRPAAVLAGKSLAVALVVAVQVAVLLAVSSLVFGIRWGSPGSMVLAGAGLVVGATGFGIMLLSFVRTRRHVGVVLGVGLTLTGMVGGLFTNFIPDSPPALGIASLAFPQGWALRAWKLAVAGASADRLLAPVGVLVLMGAAFYSLGVLLHRRRFL